jgi:hypothetical protein
MVLSTVIGKKKSNVTDARQPRPQPQRIRFPLAVLIRMFLIGSVAVVAAGWAIWRHYAVPRMPMVVPVTPAPSAPSEAEIEVDPSP